MRLVMLGAPGAGKGTQAVLLAERLAVPHISTGEMLRGEIESGSALGERVKGIMATGALVSDDVVIEVVKARLGREDCNNGFILDGFPRTIEQARALERVLEELGSGVDRVIEIVVSEEALIERIRKRGCEGSGRSDDTVEVARKRLDVYHAQTAPVSGFYREKGIVLTVASEGGVDEVQGEIVKQLML